MTDDRPPEIPEVTPTEAEAAEAAPEPEDTEEAAVVIAAPRPASTPPKASVTPWPKRPTKALAHRAPPGDHTALHSTVGRAAAGAGVGAVLADVLTSVLGTGLWDSPLLTVGVFAGALAGVASQGKPWWRTVLGGLVGLVGALLFTSTVSLWPPFAALILGVFLAPILAEGQSPARKAVTALLAGGAGAAGLYVARVMLGWDVFDGVVPSLIGHAAAGASAGLFVGLASAPRYLGRAPDPVEAAYHPALQIKDGEVHEILDRALTIHRSLERDLGARAEEDNVSPVVGREKELVLQILHIAGECRRIRADLDATPADEIRARIEALSARADQTSDAGDRATYGQTVASLEEQLEALERIENGRERVIARLHATVALLEKLRFALIHLRSADAERVGGELPLVTEALDALTDEIEATSSAVGEVYGQNALPEPGEGGAEVLALPEASKTGS